MLGGRSGGSTVSRPLPRSLLSGFSGLRDFIRVRVSNSAGKVVASRGELFCPNSYEPERATPSSSQSSPYPQECSAIDPFQKAMVWGVARGWAVDPFALQEKLSLGTYKVTETITRSFKRLLRITAANATAAVTVKVVKADDSSGRAPQGRSSQGRRPPGRRSRRAGRSRRRRAFRTCATRRGTRCLI